jgi:adenylate kinase
MVLVFIGAAGSGKDTQAEILADKYGFRVISTGQIFRDAVEKRTEEGLEAEKYTSRGDLVPDELVYRMLGKHLGGIDVSMLIFTGAVRSAPQVSLMDDTLAKVNSAVKFAVYFKLSDEEAIKRISGRRYSPAGKMYHVEYKPPKVEGIDDETGELLEQRDDDKPEAIAERLSDFHANNDAILDAYRDRCQQIYPRSCC